MNTETIDARVMDKIEAMVSVGVQERSSLLGLGAGTQIESRPDKPRAEVTEAVLVRVVAYVDTLPVAGGYWNPVSHWDNHDTYPPDEWEYEVIDAATRLGYVEWVNRRIEETRYEQS